MTRLIRTLGAAMVLGAAVVPSIGVPVADAVDNVVYATDFESDAPGADPAGWYDTAGSNSMNPADLFSVEEVDGTQALTTFSSTSNIHSHHLAAGSADLSNYSMRGRMRIDGDAGAGIGITVLSDYDQSDAYYRLRRFGATGSFHIAPHGTSISGGVVDTGIVPSVGEWYEFLVEAQDTGTRTEIRAKVWSSSDAEPADWQADAYDAGPARLATGTFGVWSHAGGQKSWDDLTVEALAPLGPYSISATTVGSGTVDTDPAGGPYVHGGDVVLTARPADGFVFAGWSGDVSASENPLILTMTADVSLTANFVEALPAQLDVAASVGGAVTVDPDQASYLIGDVVTLAATPDPGWSFSGWNGDLDGNANPVSLQLDGDTTVTATFAEQPAAFAAEDFEGYVAGDDPVGWVDTGANNSMAPSDSLFAVADVGGTKALSTTSTSSNVHSHYLVDGSDTAIAYSYTGRMRIDGSSGAGIGVTILSDYNQSDAYYRLRRYGTNGSFHLSPHGTSISSGTTDTGVVPETGTWYRFRIEAVPGADATEVRARVWADGSAEPSTWQIDAADTSSSRRTAGTIGVWSYGSGAKHWDDLTMAPIDVGPFDVITSAVGSGSVTTDPTGPIHALGSEVALTASPDAGWRFVGWSGGLSGAENPTTTTVTSDLAIIATFEEIPAYPLTTNVVGSGSVSSAPSAAEYPDGTSIVLTAMPAAGWVFAGWSGDASGSLNPITVAIDAATDVTATFAVDEPLTLTTTVTAGGTVTVDPNQSTYSIGDVITATANPDPGWMLDRWVVDPAIANAWWNESWGYRLPVEVDAAGTARSDAVVEVDVDFTAAWLSLGESHQFDPDSIRVVEVAGDGSVIDAQVPFQFDPASSYDATADASGTLTLLMAGSTAADGARSFQVYFDDVTAGLAPATVAPLISVTDGVTDAGVETIRLTTPDATYFYDKAGGGFTSIVDADGLDWIGYNNTFGSAGTYRGIPNLVYPEGFMHPGATGVTTTLVSAGPLKATLRSVSGPWETIWDVFPGHARMTVLATGHDYWFLYEGTPGGEFDGTADVVVRSDGTETAASIAWTGDLVGDEWVYVGDTVDDRSLFVVNHQSDSATDSYYGMQDNMTVVGFGRSGTAPLMSATPAEFTIGLADGVDFDGVSQQLAASSDGYSVGVADAQSLSGSGALNGEVISFVMTADQTITAEFVQVPDPALDVQTAGSGSVVVDPAQASYAAGDSVTVTATPAAGWQFAGWTGSIVNSANPLNFSIAADTQLTATFTEIASENPVIDVWHGDQQQFGALGVPQRWYNVVGNVSDPDGVATLTYRLNGGPSRPLQTGPDQRRLAAEGDFNVDLDRADLVTGANQVVITAVDGLGNQSTRTVTVQYSDNTFWPTNYTIDWSTVTDVADVAQVVDGPWTLTPAGVRTTAPDYDRLLAIGDVGWTDYELEVPFTINDIDESGFGDWISGGAAIGALFRWNGHTDNPVSGYQPKAGWMPYGALGWYRIYGSGGEFLLDGNNGTNLSRTSMAVPTVGTEYTLKMRVETVPGVGGLYSVKLWPSASPEPTDWMLTGQEGLSDPQSGSLLLVAHHVDATWGDVSVTPLGLSSYPLDASSSAGGSVTVDPDQSEFAPGELVTLTAVPDAGYVFAGWSGDLSGSSNPATLTMNQSKQVTANFVLENTSPVVSGVSVTALADSAVVSWSTDQPTSSSVAFGETTGYELGMVDDPVLRTEHSVTLSGLATDTVHHFQVTVVTAAGVSTSTPDDTFATMSAPSGSFVSDDFSACSLDTGLWTFVDPVGDSSVSVNGSQLELSVPAGTNHDVWSGGNMSARVMQPVGDVDMQLEVGFESSVIEAYELQGLVVEQDASNYLRVEFHGDGSQTKVFVARIVGGQPSAVANVSVGAVSAPSALRLSRVGDTWSVEYAVDGGAWVTAVSFDHALSVAEVGVYAGNAANAPQHTAVVDYVFNTAAPIIPEDGTASVATLTTDVVGAGSVSVDPDQFVFSCEELVTLTAVPDAGYVFAGWSGDLSGSSNPATLTMNQSKQVTANFEPDNSTSPVVSGVSVTALADSAVVSWSTDQPTSSSVAFGETTGYELGMVDDPVLRTEHSVTLSGLATDTVHHFQVTVVTAAGVSTSTPDDTFATMSSPSGSFVSDDFSACSLDTGLWTFVDPVGDSSVSVNGSQLELSVPAGTNHDVWSGGNMSARVMQPVGDVDMQLEVGFESSVIEAYELQGLVVEQDASNYLRVEFHGDGSQTKVFVARIVGGQPSAVANVSVGAVSAPSALRLSRVGDTWSVEYAVDGGAWVTAVSFDHALSVAEVGVYAGNAANAPQHTAVVDYVFNTAAPIIPEDGTVPTC